MNEREIFHFGILGMKWGVRRYQNKDGTRTELGKKHYRMNDVKRDYNEIKTKYSEKFKETKNQADQIVDEANRLGKKYEEEFNRIQPNKQIKERIYDELYRDFGTGSDDEEYFDMDVRDVIEDVVNDICDSKLSSERKRFDQLQDKYWDNVHDIAAEMISKYGEKTIMDAPVIKNGEHVVYSLLDTDVNNSFTSYIYRHFDDYWINDTDAKYAAVDRLKKDISFTDYNEYAAKRTKN